MNDGRTCPHESMNFNYIHSSTRESSLWRRLGPVASLSSLSLTSPSAAAKVPSTGKKSSLDGDSCMEPSRPSDTIAYPHKENLIAHAAFSRPPSHHNSSISSIKRYAHSRSVNPNECQNDDESLLQRRNLEPLSPLVFNFGESNVGKPHIDSKSWKKTTPVASNNKQRYEPDKSLIRNRTQIEAELAELDLKGASSESTTIMAIPPLMQSSSSTQPKLIAMTPLMRSLISKYGPETPAKNIKPNEFDTPTKKLPSVNATDSVRVRSVSRIQLREMKETPPKKAVTAAIAIVRSNDHKTFAAATRSEPESEKASTLSHFPQEIRSQTSAEAFELLKRKSGNAKSSSTSRSVVKTSSKSESFSDQKKILASMTAASPPTLLGRKDHAMRIVQQLKEQRARKFNNSIDANISNGSKMAHSLSDNLGRMSSSENLCETQKCSLLNRREAAMRNLNQLREQRASKINNSFDAKMSHDISMARSLSNEIESVSSSENFLVTQSCSFTNPNSGEEVGSRNTQLELRRKRAREILAQRKKRQLHM